MPLGKRLLPKVKSKVEQFPASQMLTERIIRFLIRTMSTIIATAVTALFEKMFGQDHQTVFKIIVNSFNEFFCF